MAETAIGALTFGKFGGLAFANPAGLLVGSVVVGGFFLGGLLLKHLVEEELQGEEKGNWMSVGRQSLNSDSNSN
jgi:hypothetical protein